ncbi:succinate dehydrogenase subunit 7B, mitochondrial-like [Euphorbia lathyris]|uniref:succinate dehydrogenase subunit 7B, mitochondrial-like n=1 Tax=Euphorbia lathyris TaxID=212925 RepID=UPI0033139C56
MYHVLSRRSLQKHFYIYFYPHPCKNREMAFLLKNSMFSARFGSQSQKIKDAVSRSLRGFHAEPGPPEKSLLAEDPARFKSNKEGKSNKKGLGDSHYTDLYFTFMLTLAVGAVMMQEDAQKPAGESAVMMQEDAQKPAGESA